MKRYKLAPMSPFIWALTAIVLTFPFIFLAASRWAIPIVRMAFHSSMVFMIIIYVFIWFWLRPTGFEIDGESFQMIWPLRKKKWSRSEITRVEYMTTLDFRKKYGWGMRFGAGGLWGGFGQLITSGQKFGLYVSRQDWLVVIHFRSSLPILVTPQNPEEFVKEFAK